MHRHAQARTGTHKQRTQPSARTPAWSFLKIIIHSLEGLQKRFTILRNGRETRGRKRTFEQLAFNTKVFGRVRMYLSFSWSVRTLVFARQLSIRCFLEPYEAT